MRRKAKTTSGRVLLQARVAVDVAKAIDLAAEQSGMSRSQFLERVLSAIAATSASCEAKSGLFDALVDDMLVKFEKAVEASVHRVVKSQGLLR